MTNNIIGEVIYKHARKLFPICRSISGEGVRETLFYLKTICNDLQIKSFKSGKKVFDWVIPNEWIIKDAFILNEKGEKIINFKTNNLHLVSYSEAVNRTMTFHELDQHLYSLPEQPEAIPYVTSYYQRTWGFCISQNQRDLMDKKGMYKVFIDSSFKKGVMNYGEIIIPGKSRKEILLSSYICHPSLANNELSGPSVLIEIAALIKKLNNRYTYRIIFIPETIGSIAYIHANLKKLQNNVVAGYVLTCIGDNNNYSFLRSRKMNSLSDRIASGVIRHIDPKFKEYTWLDRGSDERQFCSPGVDLPVASLMRTKYGEYKEYHTSQDNLDYISPEGLGGGFEMVRKILYVIENFHYKPKAFFQCEPMLGKRNLYPNLSIKTSTIPLNLRNFIGYSDGTKNILDISEDIKISPAEAVDLYFFSKKNKLIK